MVANFKDSRIRLLRFRNHGVIATSRNEGVKLAKAPFLAFLDSDDVWYPTKIEQALSAMQAGHEIVCHAKKCVRADGSTASIIGRKPTKGPTYNQLLFKGNCISTSGVSMTAQLFHSVGGFSEKPEYVTAEDYNLWLNITHSGTTIHFIDDILGEYRLHSGNLSSAAERNHRAITEVLKYHFSTNVHSTTINRIKIRRRFALAAYGCTRMFQSNKQFIPAYKWLIYSIFLWPFAPKTWAALILNLLRKTNPTH